jgi:hypothetical protein
MKVIKIGLFVVIKIYVMFFLVCQQGCFCEELEIKYLVFWYLWV